MTDFDWHKAASRREQILFGIILILSMVFFLKGVYVAKLAEARLVQAQVESFELERSVLQRFLERTPTLTIPPASPLQGDIKLMILEGKAETPFADLPSLLPRLTAPQFLEGVRVRGLAFQPVMREAGYSRVDFSLEAGGSFGEMISFLERIENLPALIHVKDLVLSAQEGRATEVRAELSLRFFKKGEAS